MTEKSSTYWRIFKGIGLFLLSVILLLIVSVTLLLNSSIVQKKAVEWTSDYLDSNFGISLSVEEIDFRPFNRLYLKKFLLSKEDVDSMVFVSEGTLTFNANPFKLFQKEVTFTSLNADSIVIRIVSNYTPTIPDTASAPPFGFFFSPAKVDIDHVDFMLRDTVREFSLYAHSKTIRGKIRSSNFKDEFSLEDLYLLEPFVEVYGARKSAMENVYIQEMLEKFHTQYPADTIRTERDSLFWKLNFDINNLEIVQGDVAVHSYDPVQKRYKDPLEVNSIFLEVQSVHTGPDRIETGPLDSRFSLGDTLVVDQIAYEKLNMSDNELIVKDWMLQFADSDLGGQVALKYGSVGDFTDFVNRVGMEVDIPSGHVNLSDVVRLVPSLATVEFIKNNRSDKYDISLLGQGSLNNLVIQRWQLKSGGTYLRGSARVKNLLTSASRQVAARINSSRIPTAFIKQKFPDVNLPQGIDSLEVIYLTGKTDVTGKKIMVDATANTKLGEVAILGNVDLQSQEYNGKIDLNRFDLGKFIQNPNIGTLSMGIRLEEAADFNLQQLRGHLQTTIDSFYFKGYNYSGVVLNGFFGNNGFLGHIGMNQPDIGFDLDTKIDFANIADFVAFGHIHRADLQKLNLTKQNLEVSGEIDLDMTLFPIDSLNGYARFNNLAITRNDSLDYNMKTINFKARSWGKNYKDWELQSDILSVMINGQFNIENILSTTYEIIKTRHPRIIEYLPDMDLETDTVYNNDFTMIIDVNDSEEFSNLLHSDLDTIRNLNLSLTYRNRGREYFEYYFQSSAPKIQFRDIGIESLNINASGSNTDNEWIVYLDSLSAGAVAVGGLQLNTTLVGDQLDFDLSTKTINNVVRSFNISGYNRFELDETMALAFDTSSFILLDKRWVLNKNNSINIGKKKLFFNNFVFQSGERNFYVQSATDESLIAGIRNVDIEFVNEFFSSKKYTFAGTANVIMSVENIFDLTGLEVETVIDDLVVNEQPFGTMNTLFYTLRSDQMAKVSVDVTKEGRTSLTVEGEYDVFNRDQNKVPIFDFDVRASQFPILVLEFFLPDIIEKTKGYVNAKVDINSDGRRPDISGRVLINGQTHIPIIGTTYEFVNSSVNVNNELISFGEINIMDKEGNLASASGGIRHHHLSDFRMETQIVTDKFLLLDKGKTEGFPFFGRGLGSATIDITGPFNQLDMNIQAKTGPTSNISIPISSTISVNDKEAFFIDFVSDASFEEVQAEESRPYVQIEGLNLEVDLTLTPDCQVSIILDESTGDILRARGYSDLQIELTRAGNFVMRGTYEVVSGEYQFAQLNFTRKMFTINQGGTITWTGDPFNAKIDIDASYSVRTPPYNFILEYIGQNDRLADLAQNATDVDLFLHLRGDLFLPDITFDMEFPELTGQVKNYVEDRLRVIADDQNEINKQVFGLLIARSFIPSVSSVVNIDGTVVNTVSEVITNQISFFLTQYLQESIDEVPFISSVELNIGYNVYRNNYTAEAQSVVKTGNEFLIQPEFGFLDNRLQMTTEANLQTGSAITSNTLITHDFILQYSITPDNRLKAKLYQRTEPYVFEKTSKLGIGLSYQEEFDNFYEFIRGRKRNKDVPQ